MRCLQSMPSTAKTSLFIDLLSGKPPIEKKEEAKPSLERRHYVEITVELCKCKPLVITLEIVRN